MKALLLLAFAGIPMVAYAGDREQIDEYSYDQITPIYEWTCEYMESEYDNFVCPPQPVVATARMGSGLWGYYYRGSAIIWVNDILKDQPLSVFGEAIIAHEAVHYVLSFIDDLQPRVDACRNENMAWIAYNEYVLSYGFEDLLNDAWWKSYSRCTGPTADAYADWVMDIIGQIEDVIGETFPTDKE